MKTLIRPALTLFIVLSMLTGLLYPAALTGLAQLLFPWQAKGSLIERDGHIVGSALIGQSFSDPRYFWGRPSATAPMPDNAAASAGSNYGPQHPDLQRAVAERIATLRAAHPDQTGPVPAELVTSSASGLDPHISPAAARYQLGRVAAARQLPLATVQALLERYSEAPSWRIFGERTVNVLALNLALDALAGARAAN